MKFTCNNFYYKSNSSHKNLKYKYRLNYVGSCIYQLTKGKYKVIKKTYSFNAMYNYIKKNNIDFNEVHLPYMTLYEFLRDWSSFEDFDNLSRRF